MAVRNLAEQDVIMQLISSKFKLVVVSKEQLETKLNDC
jgi:hypothetical protein